MTVQVYVRFDQKLLRVCKKKKKRAILNRSDDSRLLQHLKSATPLALSCSGAIWSKSQWRQMEVQDACYQEIKVCVLGPLGLPLSIPLLHDCLLVFGMHVHETRGPLTAHLHLLLLL